MQRRLTLTLLCAFLLPATSWAAPGARALRQAVTTMEPAVPVFISGRDGYRSFRIPAIVRLPGGDLLAFADGRVDGAADFGDVKIVMKRSHDGGRTWSALKVVASNDSLQADNAAPVLDRFDPAYPQGRLFLFYDTGDKPEQDTSWHRASRRVVHHFGRWRTHLVLTGRDATYYDPALPDPAAEGSLLALGRAVDGKAILAFCNDADATRRTHLGLRISFDDGRTWRERHVVDARSTHTGYSDIVELGPGTTGVLYERDDSSQIAFKVIRWKSGRQ